MNDTLEDLASSIGGAHEAVDEIADRVAERGDDPGDWYVGLTDERPPTGDADEPSVLVVETDDVASATYVCRELLQRGFAYDGDEDSGPDGRFVYAHERGSTE